MTCRCFLKLSRTLPTRFSTEDTENSQTPMDNTSKFDDPHLSQFTPASFCSYLRSLASGFSVPNKVELIVAKNCLSAFYCFIGHYQWPMQLLRPSCDTPRCTQDNLKSKASDEDQNTSGSVEGFEKGGHDNDFIAIVRKMRMNHTDGKLTSSGKESELRERKKSKYLSYPYVEGNQNGEVSSTAGQNIRDDLQNLSCGSGESTPSSELTGDNSREEGSRNSLKDCFIVSEADNDDACSAQLLSELHSFARGCFYSGRSKYSDSLKRFYFSFRTFAFLDFEMAHGSLKSQKGPIGAIAKVQKKGKDKVKESGKNQGINSESVIEDASIQETEKDAQQEKGSCKHVKAKKKEELSLSAGMEPACNLSKINDTTTVNNLCVTFQPQSSDIPKNITAKERKKGEASPSHLRLETEGSHIWKNRTPKKETNPMDLQLETRGSDILENKTPEKKNEREANPTRLQLETEGIAIPKNITPGKRKEEKSGSTHHQLETLDSDIRKDVISEKEKKGEASPMHLQFETTSRLPDLNGNISFENMEFGISATQQGTRNIDDTERPSGSGYTAAELTSNLIHNAIDSSFHNSLQKILLPSNGKPERKKWKRKETTQVTSVIPDLNETTADSPSLEKIPCVEDHISPEGDHPRKKRRMSRPNDDPGAMLLLTFALQHPQPSKETLVATFSRFGLLKESETQFLDESSVQIFYERTTDAQFAIRRLEKKNPFGESLVSFKFHPLSSASTTEMKETTTEKATSTVGKNPKKLQLPQPISPADQLKGPSAQKGDAPNFTFIRKNVEMMKMTLEKAGNNLLPEIRAKLENEIEGFLNKIASMERASLP